MTALPTAEQVATDLASTSLALARGFHRGATLWCVAPLWPHHAEHVCVEFVHPVIVGKRALPAEVLRGADPVAALRFGARSGDLLLAIGPGSLEPLPELMSRSRAWGVETVWLSTDRRPAVGAADHVLWLEDQAAAFSGELVLAYHLLWELTHVCFEHPGLLAVERVCVGDTCITCSDEAVLGEVVRIQDLGTALVRTPSGLQTVDTSLLSEVRPHDLVLLHAGLAIDAMAGSSSQ